MWCHCHWLCSNFTSGYMNWANPWKPEKLLRMTKKTFAEMHVTPTRPIITQFPWKLPLDITAQIPRKTVEHLLVMLSRVNTSYHFQSKNLPEFQFSGEWGGVFWNWKVKVTRSLTIFIFGGGGILKLKSQSAKISDNFHFQGGGGILKLRSQSAKISDNFHFQGGGILKLYFRIGVFCRIWTKISTTPAGSCITDSLSHTTYVETE